VAGDMERAIDVLRARGAAKAAKRSDREAKEGAIGSYVHQGGKVGVMVEVGCETDFVARNADFQALVRDVAMHIAAMNPLALNPEDIPADVVEREKAVYLETIKNEGKPEKMWDKIVEGKLNKFYKDSTLLDQPFVKDPDKTIRDYVTEVGAKMGEHVVIRRFVRFALGE